LPLGGADRGTGGDDVGGISEDGAGPGAVPSSESGMSEMKGVTGEVLAVGASSATDVEEERVWERDLERGLEREERRVSRR
jgi:hypothetical protein